MGILNVTPDSFSDGGVHLDPGTAVAAGRRMLAEGAGMVDVGGESARPGAAPVSPEEEQRRILPVIRALRGAVISVDTRHASTMAAALDAGATVVNDVSALSHDPDARGVVAARGCPVILMHMRGTPETMLGLAQYGDVVAEVTAELAERVAYAVAGGIERGRIAVDPGFGFAKTGDHNVALLRRLSCVERHRAGGGRCLAQAVHRPAIGRDGGGGADGGVGGGRAVRLAAGGADLAGA